MTGTRYPDDMTEWTEETRPIGGYWKINGQWHGMTPNGHMCNMSKHTVTEHEDGTITVSPSILVSTTSPNKGNTVELWHGFLERGVWRSC